MKLLLLIICCFSLTDLQVNASELVLSKSEALKLGFKPVIKNKAKSATPMIFRNQLEWPFEKPYLLGFIANNFQQYQPYNPIPAYHGGGDMILEKNSWVLAPDDGRLEAGHYSYVNSPDGTHEKQWIPWPGQGPALYFEIAVITKDNLRYELHHVDRKSIPQNILEILNSGSGEVKRGQRLARVVNWMTSFHYHHVHLNVIKDNGQAINPQNVFTELNDTIKPEVTFYAIYENRKSILLKENISIPRKSLVSFIARGFDKADGNQWKHSFTKVKFESSENQPVEIDFSQSLYDNKGNIQDFRNVYPRQIYLSRFKRVTQPSSYYPNTSEVFTMQVIPKFPLSKGEAALSAYDFSGNQVQLNFSLY